jgi:polysaccharide biosynthesis transport protein
LSDGGTPPKVVLVTSTLPGEGKTALATSLGASVARSGRKTLVMDLDLRHPSVASQIGGPVLIGLVEFINGQRSLEEIIWKDTSEANLHVIPVSRRIGIPSELLASQELRALLEELRRRYDYIILDAPPSLGSTDAKIAALLADAVLFVVQWHKTNDVIALNGLEEILKCNARLAGAALTQVNLRRHIRYGYGDVGYFYRTHCKYYVN